MLSKESFSAHPSLPQTHFFLKTFLPPRVQKRTFYHNIPTRANPKRILLSQHSIQGSSKKNTFITTFQKQYCTFTTTFLPSRAVPKRIFLSRNLPSIQGSSKRNTFITTFLPSREVPKGILLSQHSFHPGKFQKEYFYHNIPSIQGSSKRNTFITTFLPSREVPGQFHEIRKWFLISKYWFKDLDLCFL